MDTLILAQCNPLPPLKNPDYVPVVEKIFLCVCDDNISHKLQRSWVTGGMDFFWNKTIHSLLNIPKKFSKVLNVIIVNRSLSLSYNGAVLWKGLLLDIQSPSLAVFTCGIGRILMLIFCLFLSCIIAERGGILHRITSGKAILSSW